MSVLLKFTRLKNMPNWGLTHILSNDINFNKKYKIITLVQVLNKGNIEWINIENEKEYPILGVRSQGKGVYINRIALGKELTMKKYQKSKAYHLFYCKVRTVNGQWGIVYPKFENSYGSSNMQYLEIDLNELIPEYLELLLKIKVLTDSWDKNAIGADGRHFNLSTLLTLKIPLPSLEKQREIVEDYQSKVHLAQKQEKEAKEKEKEIEEYLYDELGIIIHKNDEDKLLDFINFKDIDRWDTSYLLDNINIDSEYKFVKIESIINTFLKDLDGISLRIEPKKYPNKKFNYIGMENIEKESGKLLSLQDVKGSDIKSQTIKLPKNFFLYGKLRPYLNKYYFNQYDYKNIIVSSEFFVFSIKGIDELYFKFIISSSFIQKQIENHMKGARMPRISEGTFKNLKIPLPPLKVQNKIANYIQTLKDEIKELKEKAEKNRVLALNEFEEGIFNEA